MKRSIAVYFLLFAGLVVSAPLISQTAQPIIVKID
jgi:hypothetical protein